MKHQLQQHMINIPNRAGCYKITDWILFYFIFSGDPEFVSKAAANAPSACRDRCHPQPRWDWGGADSNELLREEENNKGPWEEFNDITEKRGEKAFCSVILSHTDFFQYSPKGPGRTAVVISHKIERGHVFARILEQRSDKSLGFCSIWNVKHFASLLLGNSFSLTNQLAVALFVRHLPVVSCFCWYKCMCYSRTWHQPSPLCWERGLGAFPQEVSQRRPAQVGLLCFLQSNWKTKNGGYSHYSPSCWVGC